MTQTYTELVYGQEEVDIGGNYNHTNGRFTAPIDGLYEFAYASIGMQNATCYRYRLRINGADPASGGVYEQRLDNNSSGGNSYPNNNEYVAYLDLTAGQYVSVFHRVDVGSVNGYADAAYRYVYFSTCPCQRLGLSKGCPIFVLRVQIHTVKWQLQLAIMI